MAKGLEGLRRQDGIHAAAVVITKDPLTDYLPIQRKPESGKPIEDAPIVTQYEMHGVEDLGLLKMDFLGLRNLDVITDCVELIRRTREVEVDIDAVDLEDGPTFEMLRRGETVGVFQLESPPVRALIRSLAPTSLDDIAALVALYRPGPMAHNMHNDYADRKNGRKRVAHLHPDAEEILADTYGLMIYQENVMRMAQRFAGYSLAEADTLRKAMGKKIRSAMAEEREKFVAGVEARGYGRPLGAEMFGIIEQFADYAFNKSHSYGYGLIAYQIAYLKANYPVEYMAALLTSVKNKLENAAVYLNECRIQGIEVTVPDVNRSSSDFTPFPADGGGGSGLGRIVFGLSAVRNVGNAYASRVIAEREADGPYESFSDFCERIDLEMIHKRPIESLIKAGAFDGLGHPRKGLLWVFEQIMDMTLRRRREREQGVMSLFGDLGGGDGFEDRPDIPDVEMDRMPRLAAEKEMLGLYISDHPLQGLDQALGARIDLPLAELSEMEDGRTASVGGVITGLVRKRTRKGDPMATFELEDMGGSVEVMVFPRTMAEHGEDLANDAVVLVRGRVENRDDTTKFFAAEIEVVEPGVGTASAAEPLLKVRLPPEHRNGEGIARVKRIIEAHPGSSLVEIHLGGGQALRLPEGYGVDCTTNGILAELRVDLGAEVVVA